jgi:CHAT domain-containing protein/Tfp pilus assembly protein PilF
MEELRLDNYSLEQKRLIRRYLLGEMTEEEKQRIELRYLQDEAAFLQVELAEESLIEEYVTGRLPEAEKLPFENYFLRAPERQLEVLLTKGLFAAAKRQQQPPKLSRLERVFASLKQSISLVFSLPSLKIAWIPLVVGGFALVWILTRPSEMERGLIALQAAYHQQRPLEPRISDFSYAPPIVYRDGESDITQFDYLKRDQAARLLLDAVNGDPSTMNRHALGKYYLTSKDFDKAIDQFEQARKNRPVQYKVENDLGVAWMGKALMLGEKDPAAKGEGLTKALGYFNQALSVRPQYAEAIFNQALCYQGLKLHQQASEAWQRYLSLDEQSEWAKEAKKRLAETQKNTQRSSLEISNLLADLLSASATQDATSGWKILQTGRTTTGNLLTELLLDEYLGEGGKRRAAQYQKALSFVGDMEIERATEHFTHDLGAAYNEVSEPKHLRLTQARLNLKLGNQISSSSKRAAIEYYEKAKKLFGQIGHRGEALVADYLIASTYLRTTNTALARTRLRMIYRQAERLQYQWLLARTCYSLADLEGSLHHYSQALSFSNRALSIAERLEDHGLRQRSLAQIAQWHQEMGDYRMSLSFLERGFVSLSTDHQFPQDSWGIYTTAGLHYAARDQPATALEYFQEALRLAKQSTRPLLQSRTYSYMGSTLANLGRYQEALRSFQQALEVGSQIKDQSLQLDIREHAVLRLGQVYRQTGDYGRAAEYFEEALEIARQLKYPAELYEIWKGKFSVDLALERFVEARTDLANARDLLEKYRATLWNEEQKIQFFDSEQSLYALTIKYEYQVRGNHQRAFDYAEMSRARTMVEQIAQLSRSHNAQPNSKGGQWRHTPFALAQIRQRMPDQVQLLFYEVMDDRVLIWVLSRQAYSFAEQKITALVLQDKISSFLTAIKRENVLQGTVGQYAEELYRLLIHPIERDLNPNQELCIVPDKMLNYTPFNALKSPATKQFLIENYAISVAPSATIFVLSSERAARLSRPGPERLLGVGNPLLPASYEPLPGTQQEVDELAKFYDQPQVLVAARATEANVRARIGEAQVIHFASHSLANDHSPDYSALILTHEEIPHPSDAQDGLLRASEIKRLPLRATKLVILSACRTGIERYYKGEGMMGLARPFLSAGVPVVVASFWPVESEFTTEFMIQFHRLRRQTMVSSNRALQLAQQQMIHRSDVRISQWAAFAVLGGHSTY